MNKDTKKRKTEEEKWIKPRRSPTNVELLLITCMDNHVYQFKNQVRLQKEGAPSV